ncbi:MAG TPA: EAL domain-containing protein [Gammaproteobacteria bacterium]|nr:EAL domain-containing protein [Gammaproteobacteria bacterium]
MSHGPVPLIVLTPTEDDVALINKTLRDAGHPVRCHWVKRVEDLEQALSTACPELLWFRSDRFETPIHDVAKIRQKVARSVPMLAVADSADETALTDALLAGAQDLVSLRQRDRLKAVAERELRTFRLERALNETLRSASQYKKQLKAFVAGSVDAIAFVQEGIVVEVNQAWAELFGDSPEEALNRPLMDLFDATSQTAVKGAVVASGKGQWSNAPLSVTAKIRDGSAVELKLRLEPIDFEGEPAVKLTVPREEASAAAPEELVELTINKDLSTGFFNRRRFLEVLAERLETSPRSGVRALAYIRPDKFGEIESEVGPVVSEELLVTLADILRKLAHPLDVCGRFGGNVFAMLLQRGTLRDVEAWAENAVKQITEHIFEAADHTLSVTVTIGIAEVGPTTARTDSLIANAEKANRRGRQRGGNQVVLEETSDESTRIQRFDEIWVQQIKWALVENRLRLAHLPIASLSGERKTMFDTVLRMVDQQGDEVPAAEFMPAARRNKLLRAIDRWVIAATIDFCTKQAVDCIFVKLSHESLLDTTLPDWLVKLAQEHSVAPSRLCFQVGEDDATQYLKQTRAIAEQLKGSGFLFAVEHFGVGRDPMRVLTQTPMHYVKFDGSLMQTLATDHGLQEQMRSYIKAAEKRKILTIAERVENANTMAVLFQLGAAYMQGHYLQEAEVVLSEH